jgi:hypothetical protein
LRQVDYGLSVRSFHYVFLVKLVADSYFLRDGVIHRLFELGGEKGTDGPETMLSGAVCLMGTIDEESEADRWE